jgi:hypothetical protein
LSRIEIRDIKMPSAAKAAAGSRAGRAKDDQESEGE